MTTPIIPLPLPNQIADGQPAAAAPVMANLNFIATNVNANAATSAPVTVFSGVQVNASGGNSLSSGINLNLGTTTSGATKAIDVLNEFSTSTGLFTTTAIGNYWVSVTANLDPNTGTLGTGIVRILKNGAQLGQDAYYGRASTGSAFTDSVTNGQLVALVPGDTIAGITELAFTGGPAKLKAANITIVRLS